MADDPPAAAEAPAKKTGYDDFIRVAQIQAKIALLNEKYELAKEDLEVAEVKHEAVMQQTEQVATRLKSAMMEREMLRTRAGIAQVAAQITWEDEKNLRETFSIDLFDILGDLKDDDDKEINHRAAYLQELHGDPDGDGEIDEFEKNLALFLKTPRVSVTWEFRNAPQTPKAVAARTAEYRVREGYTFGDLKEDVCRTFRVRNPMDHHLWDPERLSSWPEGKPILPMLRLEQHAHQRLVGRIQLRVVPESFNDAIAEALDRKHDKYIHSQLVARATKLNHRADTLRAIVSERVQARHIRALIFRGVLHTAFTVFLFMMLNLETTVIHHGYETQAAVKNALLKPFTLNHPMTQDISCADLVDPSARAKLVRRPGPVLEDFPPSGLSANVHPYFPINLQQINTTKGVEQWLRGPLLDALAPRCAYNGAEYDNPHLLGAVDEVNVMFMPLRLQQTRYQSPFACRRTEGTTLGLSEESFQNYPNLGGADADLRYPACATVVHQGADGYGPPPASRGRGDSSGYRKGFSYTAQEDVEQMFWYKYCGSDALRTNDYKCYGPGGFIADMFRAERHRKEVNELLDSGWIDKNTESVSVHLQLVNQQTGCMVFALVLFEVLAGGKVLPTLKVQPLCVEMERPNLMKDASGFATPDILELSYTTMQTRALYWATWVYVGFLVYALSLKFYHSCRKGTTSRLGSSSTLIDATLFFLMVAWQGYQMYTLHLSSILQERLQESRRRDTSDELLQQIKSARLGIVAAFDAGSLSTEDMQIALTQLKNAVVHGTPFEGEPWGLNITVGTLDQFHFYYANDVGNWGMHTRAFGAMVLTVCLFKIFRYLQVWRQFGLRYAGLCRAAPKLGSFFIILLHQFVALGVVAFCLFSLDDFENFGTPFRATYFFLHAYMRSDVAGEDIGKHPSNGLVFISIFTLVVLYTNGLVIAVICEGWDSSTTILHLKNEQRRELRKVAGDLHKMYMDMKEYARIAETFAGQSDEDLLKMAALHDKTATEVKDEAGAVKNLDVTMEAKPRPRKNTRRSLRKSGSREAAQRHQRRPRGLFSRFARRVEDNQARRAVADPVEDPDEIYIQREAVEAIEASKAMRQEYEKGRTKKANLEGRRSGVFGYFRRARAQRRPLAADDTARAAGRSSSSDRSGSRGRKSRSPLWGRLSLSPSSRRRAAGEPSGPSAAAAEPTSDGVRCARARICSDPSPTQASDVSAEDPIPMRENSLIRDLGDAAYMKGRSFVEEVEEEVEDVARTITNPRRRRTVEGVDLMRCCQKDPDDMSVSSASTDTIANAAQSINAANECAPAAERADYLRRHKHKKKAASSVVNDPQRNEKQFVEALQDVGRLGSTSRLPVDFKPAATKGVTLGHLGHRTIL